MRIVQTVEPQAYAATVGGPSDGMNALERVALYAVAIQTGLRSAELRSLVKSDLFLCGDKPYTVAERDAAW